MKILPRLARYTAGGVGTPKAPHTWLSPGPALVPSGHCLRPSPAPHATRAGGGEGDTAHAALRPITHLRQPRWAPGPEPGTPRLPHGEPPPRRQQHNQRHHAEETREPTHRLPPRPLYPALPRLPTRSGESVSAGPLLLQGRERGDCGAGLAAGARGAGARDTTGGQRRGCSRASRGWPLGASFALTPPQPSVPTAVAQEDSFSGEVLPANPRSQAPRCNFCGPHRADETRRGPTREPLGLGKGLFMTPGRFAQGGRPGSNSPQAVPAPLLEVETRETPATFCTQFPRDVLSEHFKNQDGVDSDVRIKSRNDSR